MSEDSNTPSVPEQVEHLLNLKPGWDSYDAVSPDPATVHQAAKLVASLAHHFSYPATLVPCSGGNVQIEWHCDGWDIECWVNRAGT